MLFFSKTNTNEIIYSLITTIESLELYKLLHNFNEKQNKTAFKLENSTSIQVYCAMCRFFVEHLQLIKNISIW